MTNFFKSYYSKVKTIDDIFENDAKLKIMLSNNIEALEYLIKKGHKMGSNSDIIEMFKQKTLKIEKSKGINAYKTCEEYIEYKRALWQVNHPNEPMQFSENDDLAVILPSEENFICPLSRVELVEPVKNQICGHVFSKAIINEYIRSGNSECPVAGCSAKLLNLVEDVLITKKLKEKKNNKKRKNVGQDL